MKRSTWVEIISALFILLFLYTAINKTLHIDSTSNVLKSTPGFREIAIPIAWGVVFAEYLVVILLFFPRTKKVGIYGSLILMAAFTLYIALMKFFLPNNLPCSCGGVISKMTWTQHLFFNIIFTTLALIALILERKFYNLNQQEIKHSQAVII